MKKLNVAIWGTGYLADQLFHEVDKADGIEKDDIKICCDNDETKHGNKFHGVNVVSPEILRNSNLDFLVIANKFQDEIRKQIREKHLVSGIKIVGLETYRQLLYTRRQYLKRYGRKHESKSASSIDKRIVVYTSITGNYDNLIEPGYIDDNITYICVTNNQSIVSKVWNVLYTKDEKLSNVMLARRIKLLPGEYFDSNGLVVWVDANLPIRANLMGIIDNYMQNTGMLCFPHSERSCIYDETAAVIKHRPDIKREVILQAADYIQKGMPTNFGLYETGCMVRDLKIPFIKEIMGDWWDELVRHTYRDQMSLPYVCWKNNFMPDICDQSIRLNEWFDMYEHKYET